MNVTRQNQRRKSIDEFTDQERQALAKTYYQSPNYFMQAFATDRVEFDCRHQSVALRAEIERLLLERKVIEKSVALEQLHEHLSEEMKAYNFNDGVNKVSTYLYDTDDRFISIYHQFIKFIKDNVIKEHFLFQATPTIRVHCPNAINSELYPRYHTDICYGHPYEEINIWFPLTDLQEGHGFSILSFDDSKKVLEQFDYDYAKFIHNATYDRNFSDACQSLAEPVLTDFGKMLLFDSRCIHSGEPLKLHTRVSIDIRILPLSSYEKMNIDYRGSGRQKILFMPGHCYHQESSMQFYP